MEGIKQLKIQLNWVQRKTPHALYIYHIWFTWISVNPDLVKISN